MAIRRETFYLAALGSPIVVPLIALAAIALAPKIFFVPGVLIAGSLIYSWWSYPAFALGVLIWGRARSASEMERASLVLPLLYAPMCGLQSALLYGRPVRGVEVTLWVDFLGGVLLALVFGYAYVGAVRAMGRRFVTTAAIEQAMVPRSSAAASPPHLFERRSTTEH